MASKKLDLFTFKNQCARSGVFKAGNEIFDIFGAKIPNFLQMEPWRTRFTTSSHVVWKSPEDFVLSKKGWRLLLTLLPKQHQKYKWTNRNKNVAFLLCVTEKTLKIWVFKPPSDFNCHQFCFKSSWRNTSSKNSTSLKISAPATLSWQVLTKQLLVRAILRFCSGRGIG